MHNDNYIDNVDNANNYCILTFSVTLRFVCFLLCAMSISLFNKNSGTQKGKSADEKGEEDDNDGDNGETGQ